MDVDEREKVSRLIRTFLTDANSFTQIHYTPENNT